MLPSLFWLPSPWLRSPLRLLLRDEPWCSPASLPSDPLVDMCWLPAELRGDVGALSMSTVGLAAEVRGASGMAVVGGKRAERLDRSLYLEEVEWSSAEGRGGDSAFCRSGLAKLSVKGRKRL